MASFSSPSKEEIVRSFGSGDETLLAAMAAAFGLVACSDAILAKAETDRFFEIVRVSETLSNLPWAQIEDQFKRTTNDILGRGAEGREAALALVAAVKNNDAQRDAVIACVQIAVVSDFEIKDVEEYALKDICLALDVSPEEV